MAKGIFEVFTANRAEVLSQLRNYSDFDLIENVQHYIKGRIRARQEMTNI